jgi:hypothetical protein
VQLSLSPAPFRLGTDAEGWVTVQLPPSARELRLYVSRGAVEAPGAVSPGVWRARFTPPERRFPQLAILAAVATDAAGAALHGWTVLPLWGAGVAEVRARPGAEVFLTVEGERFGPVRADARGRAEVPVLVPPTAGAAYYGTRPVPLGLPPVPRIHALAERQRVRADREERVVVRLYAVSPDGRPRAEPPRQPQVSLGALGPLRVVAPGVFEADWTLPAGPAGEASLLAPDGEGLPPARLVLARESGPARDFALRALPAELVAAEGAEVRVEVEARDAAGNPAEAPAGLAVRTPLGAVALEASGEGRWVGRLPVAPSFAGRTALALVLEADARAEGAPGEGAREAGEQGGAQPAPGGGLSRAEVALLPGAPARLTATPEAGQPLVADGRTPLQLAVRLTDAWGNPVPAPEGPEVRADAAAGTARLSAQGAGGWRLALDVPRAHAPVRARVALTHGALRTETEVPLRPWRPRLTLTAGAGAVGPVATAAAPSATVQLAFWPGGALPEGLGLALEGGALGLGGAAGAAPGLEGLTASASSVLLGVGPAWRTLAPWGEAWASAGPLLARVVSRVELAPGLPLEEGAWTAGAEAAVGTGLRLGPGLPFVELRARWLSDPSLLGLRGTLRAVGLQLGYRLELL